MKKVTDEAIEMVTGAGMKTNSLYRAYGGWVLVAVVSLLLSSTAFADVSLYSTFGPGNSYRHGPIGPQLINTPPNPGYVTYEAIAAKFTVTGAPEERYKLTSINAAMFESFIVTGNGTGTDLYGSGAQSSVSLSIASDRPGNLPSILETTSGLVGLDQVYSFYFSGNTVLDVGSTYWVVAKADFGPEISAWAYNDQGFMGVGVYNGPNSFYYYTDSSAVAPAFRVNAAEVMGVPEPTSLLLLGLGLIGVVGIGRKVTK